MRRLAPSFPLLSIVLALGCASAPVRTLRDAAVVDAEGADAGIDGAADPDAGHDAGASDLDAGVVSVTVVQIQDATATGHVAPGARARVASAVVTAVDAFEELGAGAGHVSDVWIADAAGGAFSGVHVYMPTATACAGRVSLAPGDEVEVEGTVQEFAVPTDTSGRSVTQLVGATVVCRTASTTTGPAALVVADPAMLTGDAAEAYEGVLVELANVEATGDADAFGTQPLRVGPPIDDDLYRHPASRRDRFDRVRGILHYMFGRWELLPRSAADVALGAPRDVEDGAGAWGCGDDADSDGDGAIDCADGDCSTSAFCRGTRHSVQDLQDATRPSRPAIDALVSLRGPLTVTSIDTFAETTGDGYVGTVVVQDAAATDARYAGIHVFVPDVEACGGALALGDQVFVAGRYEEHAAPGDTGGTLTEITSGLVSCRAPGTPVAATPIASAADLATATSAEPWEGVLVAIGGVTVTMGAGTYGRFQVTGGVYVDDDVYRATVAVGDPLATVRGVVSYAFEPQLEPRMASDVVAGPSERTEAACGNGTDDDGDGAIDCADPECCATAVCRDAVRRLVLSEVLYDATGGDDGNEWIEVRNAGTTPLPLTCYAMGSGAVSYAYSMAPLPQLVVPAGGCVVLGGPTCGSGTCTSVIDFTPDLHNGTSGSASGLGIFYGATTSISAASVPVDAVLYGTANTAMLRDRTGAIPTSAHVADVTGGHSIARAPDGSWVDQTVPNPGTCTTYTP